MKKALVFFCMCIAWQICFAEQIYLKCSGVERVLIGENIYAPNSQSDIKTFELVVDTKKPELYGFPTRIAPGCFDKSFVQDQVDETKSSCTISDIQVSCKCDNKMAESSLMLSRRTGLFEITSTYKKSNTTMGGKFSCTKSSAKIF